MEPTDTVFLVLQLTHSHYGPISLRFIRDMTGFDTIQIEAALVILREQGLIRETLLSRYTLTEQAKRAYTWL